jgi:hypothetical protein
MSIDFSPVYSPRFELSVGGNSYRETDGRVGDLVVETTVDGAALCSFTLNYPFDPERREFVDFDWGTFEPGVDIEASVGWGGEGTVEPVFIGTGQSIRMEATPDSGPSIAVSAYGRLTGRPAACSAAARRRAASWTAIGIRSSQGPAGTKPARSSAPLA